MITRLIQMQASPAAFDQVMAAIKERVIPAVRSLPGCRVDYFAGDAAAGRIVSFVLFEGPEGTAAAEALFAKLRPQVEALGVRFEKVENLPLLAGG